ncbi:chaplin [Streptomyces sp. NPDC051104]|uniref:chaplin n=1 Tax=Streptomyces sp. NPDC051104 TaxID=3155044 RepID=UPI003442A5F7
MIAVAAASGAMAVALPAHADSAADGTAAGSPGLISGSTLQVPVHVPVNVCGNTVDVVGLLNPAAGNACENRGAGPSGPGQGAVSGGGATAHTGGKASSGVLAGNGLQLPVDIPVNVTGNSVSVAGAGNASVGNTSTNTSSTARPAAPPKAHTVVRTAPPVQQAGVTLAHTGADVTLPALAGSGALLLGGTLLYRRFRSSATR